MSKIINIIKILFLILGLLFITYAVHKFMHKDSKKTYTVIRIVDADKFYIDFNKNDKPDLDELVKISAVNSLKPSFSPYYEEQLKYIGIDKPSGVLVGNLANKYAEHNILYKNVKVKFTKEKYKEEELGYRFAQVYLNGQDWAIMLLNQGLATVYRPAILSKQYLKYENTYKIKENAKQELGKNYVIVNLKTEKYHKLTCKYGQMIRNFALIQYKDLPKFYQKCTFCFSENKKENLKQEQVFYKHFDMTSGVITMYFTDFTKNLMPSNTLKDENSRVLIKLISNAKSTIDIAAYGIDYNERLMAALSNAKKRGVKIRLVADKNVKGETTYQTQKMEKYFDKIVYDDVNYDENIGFQFTKKKKKAKLAKYLMHNKFIVFDNAIVYTGSMNIARNDLSAYNSNVSIVINSLAIAKIYKQEFEQMFYGKFHDAKSATADNENIILDANNTVSVYFSPQDNVTNNKIIPLINKAKTYIYIPIFSFTDKNLMSAIEAAKNRGVDVKVITDAANSYGEKFVVNRFRARGIPVKVENYAGKMHMKSIIIDDTYIITGSMNFTNSGQYHNDENIIVIKNPQLAKNYKNQFLYTYSKINDRWLKYSPAAESHNSIGACEDGVDNDFDGFIDSEDTGCSKQKKYK